MAGAQSLKQIRAFRHPEEQCSLGGSRPREASRAGFPGVLMTDWGLGFGLMRFQEAAWGTTVKSEEGDFKIPRGEWHWAHQRLLVASRLAGNTLTSSSDALFPFPTEAFISSPTRRPSLGPTIMVISYAQGSFAS
ncbi:hypothetical protein DNTS_017147 [Danionella cerebrum]|uniref:Uncharacterized protein n=1 Tax=Danionella cerebrum TaxID=2873325 RepID=A0A553NG88_9TELE|nr:hypothetical protein DNTS_017147 [Danionella translucida]